MYWHWEIIQRLFLSRKLVSSYCFGVLLLQYITYADNYYVLCTSKVLIAAVSSAFTMVAPTLLFSVGAVVISGSE